MPFAATWMQLEILIPSKVRQRETNIIGYHWYVESENKIQMNIFREQIQTHRHRKQTYQEEKTGRGSNKLGIWD